MKLVFNEAELAWLHETALAIGATAFNMKNTEMARLAGRIRYKFTPNAAAVFLNGKERRLVLDVVSYAKERAQGLEVLSPDRAVMDSIETKLKGARSETHAD
jgi:hypothetical protein